MTPSWRHQWNNYLPVIVGFVWNFSHRLTIMTNAATNPMATKQNHMNLKNIGFILKITSNLTITSLQMVFLSQQCTEYHVTLNYQRTPLSDITSLSWKAAARNKSSLFHFEVELSSCSFSLLKLQLILVGYSFYYLKKLRSAGSVRILFLLVKMVFEYNFSWIARMPQFNKLHLWIVYSNINDYDGKVLEKDCQGQQGSQFYKKNLWLLVWGTHCISKSSDLWCMLRAIDLISSQKICSFYYFMI